jgi:hypothetical protein
MKSNRSRSWIMIGGLVGLILGVVFPLTISGSEEEGGWKLQIYAAIAPSADRAIGLVGYNYQKELLYVKGQSQKVYECRASMNSDPDPNACFEATAEAIAQLGSLQRCTSILVPIEDPPGRAISQLKDVDCRSNEYQIVQINYAILDDGSLWRLYDNSLGVLGNWFKEVFVIAGAIVGTLLGLAIGMIVVAISKVASALSKNHPRSSA